MHNFDDVAEYLTSKACVPAENGDFVEGVMYQNMTNFQMCYIPKEDIDDITYCDIIFELEIEVPHSLEEHYHQFVEFRKHLPVTK